jgi:hypothetical protein
MREWLCLVAARKTTMWWVNICMLQICFWITYFWMPEPIIMKLGMYIMASEHISTGYFINSSHQSVCLYGYPLSLLLTNSLTHSWSWGLLEKLPIAQPYHCYTVAKSKSYHMATDAHATTEELLDVSFSMWRVFYRKIRD